MYIIRFAIFFLALFALIVVEFQATSVFPHSNLSLRFPDTFYIEFFTHRLGHLLTHSGTKVMSLVCAAHFAADSAAGFAALFLVAVAQILHAVAVVVAAAAAAAPVLPAAV